MIGFLRRIPELVRGHWGATLLVAAFFVGTSAFESALLPLVFRFVIDDVLAPRDETLLVPLLISLIAAGVLYAVVSVTRDVIHARWAQTILAAVRERLYAHLQRQSVGFHTRVQTPTLVAHFTTDLASVESALTGSVPWVLTGVFGLAMSAALLFTIEWRLALLALVGLGLSTVGPALLGRRAKLASMVVYEQQAKMAARVHEDLAAHQTVLAFGLQGNLLSRFRRQLANYYALSAHAQILGALVERTPNLAMLAFNLTVLGVGTFLVFGGSMSMGALVSFHALASGLAFSVGNITWSMPGLIAGDAGLTRIDQALGSDPEVRDAPAASIAQPLRDGIEFDHVTFGYDAAKPNLRDLSLRVPARTFCCFVGPSGCGKSTVLNLVLRFFDAQQGSVRWDGADVRSFTQESLRGQMAVVFQDNVVFNDTLRNNLAIGFAAATDEQMRAALRDAELLSLVERHADGLDMRLGEGGVRLSGGQRQRLAIARAMLRDPSVLILDEATSALDPATEAPINEMLRRIGRSRTVLSVTHRLSSAVSADLIFALREGRVAESGTHEQLLRKSGLYADLWAKQSGFQISADGDWATVSAERLRQLPLLAELDAPQLDALAKQFQPEMFQAEREVFHEGDPGDRFYLIARGEVEVFGPESDRRIAVLRDGDHFGELALLYNQPRSATIRTTASSVLLSLRRRHFLDLMQGTPALRAALEREAERRRQQITA